MNEVIQAKDIIVTPDVASTDTTYVVPHVSSEDHLTMTASAFGCPNIVATISSSMVANSDMGEVQLDLVFNYANQLAILEREYKYAESLASINPTQTNQAYVEDIRTQYEELIDKVVSHGGGAGGTSSAGGNYVFPISKRNGNGSGGSGSDGGDGGGSKEKNPPGQTLPPQRPPSNPPNPPAIPPWGKREDDDDAEFECLQKVPVIDTINYTGNAGVSYLKGYKNFQKVGDTTINAWYRKYEASGELTLMRGSGCAEQQSRWETSTTTEWIDGSGFVTTGDGFKKYDNTDTLVCSAGAHDVYALAIDPITTSWGCIGYTCGDADTIGVLWQSSSANPGALVYDFTSRVMSSGICVYNGGYGNWYKSVGSMTQTLSEEDTAGIALANAAYRGGSVTVHHGNGTVLSAIDLSTGQVNGQNCTADVYVTGLCHSSTYWLIGTADESDYPGGGGTPYEHSIFMVFVTGAEDDDAHVSVPLPMPTSAGRQVVLNTTTLKITGPHN